MTSETRDESGWDRRRAEVSRRIEVATLEMCLQRGIDEVTVDEIAVAAGISRRTFYRYFETIDDVLNASPRRSLERIARSVRARPASENIRQAFVAGTQDSGPSAEERALQVLGAQLAQRYPDPWWRALNRMQPTAKDVFEGLVAERLPPGAEPAHVTLIAGVLNAVIGFSARNSQRDGKFAANTTHLDATFAALADVLRA